LPSGYNRDFQLTKEPYMKGVKLAKETIEIATLVIENLVAKKVEESNVGYVFIVNSAAYLGCCVIFEKFFG
jgi:argininosuccinate lyase